MKYLYLLIILTFISCQKETKNSRIDLSGKYLVNYHKTYTYQVNSINGDIVFTTTKFDTVIPIIIVTTEKLNSNIQILGLKEFDHNENFSDYETQPILRDNGKFYFQNEVLFGTSGFLINDSISYKIDRTVGLESNYITINGSKI